MRNKRESRLSRPFFENTPVGSFGDKCRRGSPELRSFTRWALILLGVFYVTAPRAPADTVVIRAAGYVDAAGDLKKQAFVVVENGVVSAVGGSEEERKKAVDAAGGTANVHDYERAIVSPGLIDILGSLGAVGQLSAPRSALQADLQAQDALDPFHRQIREAREAGVTCFALNPDDSNLIGGRVAVCKTWGPGGRPQFLDAGPLKLSLASEVLQADREPTSRSGALEILRREIEEARQDSSGGSSGPASGTPGFGLSGFARGQVAGLVTAPTGSDVVAMLQLAGQYNLKLVLIHELDIRAVASDIAAAKAATVVGPYTLAESPRSATGAALLERAGVKVAIGGGLPRAPADGLRVGAAVAARNGMSLAAARRAITSVPAELLGAGDRIGSIEKGKAADLVVFSGDPLDLRSRVLAVYVDGRRLHATAAEK